MTISEEALETIRNYAIHMDWDIAFEGRSRGNQHLQRVNKIVVFLAVHEKAKLDICVAGGWLHDMGLVKGNRHHCFKGAGLAREFLYGLKLQPEVIERIVHCIMAHDGEIEAETLEAKAVHDADTIDKMGPFGFIRHVWKMSLVEDMEMKELVRFARNHIAERESHLYFQRSRDLIKGFNAILDEFLSDEVTSERIARSIADSAFKGIPSEKVAEMILKDPSPSIRFRDSTKSQMVVDYLE